MHLNPVLLMASDSAANESYPLAAREAFRAIERNAQLEARLIDDLLDLTRIEHGQLGLDIQTTDAHLALRDAVGSLARDAKTRGLNLEVNLVAGYSMLLGDGARLRQIFWNILNDAIRSTPIGGSIRIASEWDQAAHQMVVRVSDSGIGGGLGLGLAITRKLVKLHSGTIEAESDGTDQGATFVVRLPLIAVQSDAAHPIDLPPPATPGSPTPVAPTVSGRILLIEDHDSTRNSLANLLTRRGYHVVSVASSADALREAALARFDLVLSDIGLPDGDGFTLMGELRRLYGFKGIALTGYGMDADVRRSWEAGFVAHLVKPISVTVLDRALATAFGPEKGK